MSKRRRVDLGELAASGRSVISGPFGSNIGKRFFKDAGVPVIRGNNLTTNYIKFVDEGFVFLAQDKADELNAYAIENDLIFTAAGTIGQVGIIPKSSSYKQYVISNKQLRFRVDPQKADVDYIYFWLASPWIYSTIQNRNTGSTVPLINLGTIKSLPVELPVDVSEQKKIAAVLSALDAKIELNNRINAELEAMAKTLYDYWFVQFDFPFDFAQGRPDANGRPYKSSGGKMVYNKTLKRHIPEGWEYGTAACILEFNPTLALKKNSEAAYIDMDALPLSGYMTKRVQRKKFGGGVKFKNGDVVFARITPCLENGKTGLITLLEEDEVGFGSTEFIVIRGRNRSLSGFSACLARSEYFRKFAILNMTGTSGRKRIDANILETISLPLPPNELLAQFEKVCTPTIKKLTANTKETQHLTNLRDFLLPMLMNGQVEVS